MKTKTHVYGLIITLSVLSLIIFSYRYFVLDVPLRENSEVESWLIEASFDFKAEQNVPVKASFSVPYTPPGFIIMDEYFISQNYGVSTHLNQYNRRATWSIRRASGHQTLYYRIMARDADSIESLPKPPSVKPIKLEDNEKKAVTTITNHARNSSADIQTFAQSTVKELMKQDGNAKLLIGNTYSDEHLISAAITVLNQANIYAMPVYGLVLNQHNNHANLKPLLAVFNEKKWVYVQPDDAQLGLPKHFFIWQYGNEPLYLLAGGTKPQFNISVSPTPMNALSLVNARGLKSESELIRFSLLQLPLNAQETFKILLTVPIGTFIILILRNFIGLATFGTFMPVLIALAFRETHVLWGIALFTFIISFGLLARFYLDHLKLLLVPRLSAILTIVILLMMFLGVISINLGFSSGLSVALFPMVILTMTIERMCITWDERGPLEAMKSGLGSLLAAVLCYVAMNYKPLQYLFFAFPELLLLQLALTLAFGQYRGYRLSELIRFRELSGLK